MHLFSGLLPPGKNLGAAGNIMLSWVLDSPGDTDLNMKIRRIPVKVLRTPLGDLQPAGEPKLSFLQEVTCNLLNHPHTLSTVSGLSV